MKKNILILALTFITMNAFADNTQLVVQNGHFSSINTLVTDSRGLYFSASDDGSVKIWNDESHDLIRHIQISNLPITHLAVHPEKTQIAVIETDEITLFRLTVWDWESNEKIFSQLIDMSPFFLDYSPDGEMIFFSTTEWQSITFLNSQEGYRLPLFDEGFGIVSTSSINPKGNLLCTYSPIGKIDVWDLETEENLLSVPVPGNLEDTEFNWINGKPYLKGHDIAGDFHVINGANGSTRSLSPGDLRNSAFIPGTMQFAFFTTSTYKHQIIFQNILSGESETVEFYKSSGFDIPNQMTIIGDQVILAQDSGKIQSINRNGDKTELSQNTLLNLTDAAISHRWFLFASPTTIHAFNYNQHHQELSFEPVLHENPIGSPTGITVYGDYFLLWRSQGNTGKLVLFNPDEGVIKTYQGITNSIQSLRLIGNDKIIFLDNRSRIGIYNLRTQRMEYEYSGIGLSDISYIDDETLIAGRAKSATTGTPLLMLNSITSETIGLNKDTRLIFNLEYDDLTGTLYTLGIEEFQETTRTVLRSHSGYLFEKTEPLFSFPGEELDASFLLDPEDNKIYTSLGNGDVKLFYWDGFTDLESSLFTPQKLFTGGNLVLSLNKERSITAWDKNSGKIMYEFFLFNDSTWLALYKNEGYHASVNGENHLRVYQNGETDELLRQQLKLN